MSERIILFAGKGGVGKTTIASATGVSCSKRGKKTLVMSLDVAHSLSDSFDIDRRLMDRHKGNPVKVNKNLWIQEIDVQEEIEANWKDIHKYISTLFNATGLDEILAEEMAILPGMEEVSALFYINRYFKEKKFDVILLDCAPTGESLRFISMPTALEWYMKKLFKLERNLARIVRPIANKVTSVPIPEDRYFQSIQILYDKLSGIEEIMKGYRTTSVRLITNPEKIVIKETQRSFMYFCLYGMHVDSIFVNRIMPDAGFSSFFKDWKKIQNRYIHSIEDYFSPIPIKKINLQNQEVVGFDNLEKFGREIYGKKNPLTVSNTIKPFSFRKIKDQYKLSVALPFVDKKDIDLSKSGDELIIRIGSFKRYIPLPRYCKNTAISNARFKNKELTIFFKGGAHHEEKEKN